MRMHLANFYSNPVKHSIAYNPLGYTPDTQHKIHSLKRVFVLTKINRRKANYTRHTKFSN